jgi:hypothetical protein
MKSKRPSRHYITSFGDFLTPVSDHNMSEKKRGFPSVLLSPFRVLKGRPPPPNNAAQASVAIPSSNAEPLADSSRILPLISHSQTVNESPDQRPDQNTPNPQR